MVSDCGALRDISEGHGYADSDAESAALAIKAGCNLNCGWAYERLIDAYEMDLITEEDLTAAAEKLYTIRFLLGEFEEKRPYGDIPYRVVDCKEYQQLNLEAARECMVLLKNQDAFLPLSAEEVQSIAVIGPNSMSVTALEGNYNGYASRYITVADGIRQVFPNAEIRVSKGCHLWYESKNEWNGFGNIHSDGMAMAAASDLTILCLGLDSTIEGEDGMVSGDYTVGGDKRNLYLPKTQQRLAESVCDVCENVVVVLMAGSSLDLGEKVHSHAKAVIQAWYPGAIGGLAVAQLLAGVYSPSGKLPVTFYQGDSNMPDFTDYTMDGRTYRYYRGKPLYPFGFGLRQAYPSGTSSLSQLFRFCPQERQAPPRADCAHGGSNQPAIAIQFQKGTCPEDVLHGKEPRHRKGRPDRNAPVLRRQKRCVLFVAFCPMTERK